MKRWIALLLTLMLALPGPAIAAKKGLPLQEVHRVTLTKQDTTQSNKSVIRLWHAETALPAVDGEINGLAEAYAEEIGPTLKQAANSTSKNSRVDVEIRYSRTGTSWLSFMVQARTTYHRALTGQQFTTRTYDMATGQRITLTDIFPTGSPAWSFLAQQVRTGLEGYFPDETPDPDVVDSLTTPEALAEAEFTLHGMSLVLHYGAETLYPSHHTLIEVTCMYPDLQLWMTQAAYEQTNNASLYSFCALTFDDGPSRTNTTNVLQSLMMEGVRGTFFVIGNRISDYADLVQREHDEGHSIGAHNWHHGNVSKSKESALRQMPSKVNKAMYKAIGTKVRYDRVPYGLYPQMIKARVGWAYIQWSLDTYDWRGLSTAKVMSTIRSKIADGDIILMHDIKEHTPASAQAAAQWLQENGYMLLTIDELFAKDGIQLKPNTVYWHNADGETGLISK